MEDNSDHIAIVFPVASSVPTDFDIQEGVEAHCTLIYLGRISEVSYTKEDVQAVLDRVRIKDPGDISTEDLALFGPDEDVLVMTLDPEKLNPLRETIERALAKIGAKNGSEFKEYRPHVTLDSASNLTLEEASNTINIPSIVTLEAPEVWWGDEE